MDFAYNPRGIMVSISNIAGINLKETASKSMPVKSSLQVNFGNEKSQDKVKEENQTDYKHDHTIENTVWNKFKVDVEKTANIPFVHFPRGLGGAPDYTFFEFLQTAKFPYYVGGPILAALFYAGVKFDQFQSGKAAKNVAKHMALGVGLYYLGAMAAKSIINTSVKLTRGIDLEQSYRKIIPTSTNQTGAFKKDIEYHKVFESVDFTRWDLLYEEGKNTEEINEKYNKLARKYGLNDENMSDSDSTLKPLIKKTIVMAKAWQYALTALYVSLGIGMANQKAWEKESFFGFKEQIKEGIFGENLSIKSRLKNSKNLVMDYMIKPFGKSFMEFWEGTNKLTSAVGKSTILAAGAATLLANILIIAKTSARNHQLEKTPQAKSTEEKKN